MTNQEDSTLYEVFKNLPPHLQKEFFHQLELSQKELQETLLAEVEKIKAELQELKNPSIPFRGQDKIPFSVVDTQLRKK